MLDGGAALLVVVAIVDASRSKAAESQPAPRLGAFGDPSLAERGDMRYCFAQAVCVAVDRGERRRQVQVFFFLALRRRKREASE